MKVALEKTLKKKTHAAVGQSPSLSKQKAATPPSLTRAPISQPATKPPPTVQQLLGMVQAFQEPPLPPAPQLARPASAVQEPLPIAAPQARMAPTFPQSLPMAPFQIFRMSIVVWQRNLKDGRQRNEPPPL